MESQIQVSHDPQPQPVRKSAPVFIIHCPRCATFAASARTEGRAIRGIARHLVAVHHVPKD